jgi:hypothetical protein
MPFIFAAELGWAVVPDRVTRFADTLAFKRVITTRSGILFNQNNPGRAMGKSSLVHPVIFFPLWL